MRNICCLRHSCKLFLAGGHADPKLRRHRVSMQRQPHGQWVCMFWPDFGVDAPLRKREGPVSDGWGEETQ